MLIRTLPALPGPILLAFILCAGLGAFIAVSAASGADRAAGEEFDWRVLPEAALLRPKNLFISDRFSWVSSTEKEVSVRFHGPQAPPSPGGNREEFRFVMIAPPAGIRSVSLEFAERLFFKDGDRVHVEDPPPLSPASARILRRAIGEIRGAQLIQIDYKPSLNPSVRAMADTEWISDATLILELEAPFQPARELPPLLSRPLKSLVINPGDAPRCFPPLSPTAPPEERLQDWRSPSLKFSTEGAGWQTVTAARLASFWGTDLRVEELGLYTRGALLGPPSDLQVPGDPTRTEDTQESLFVLTPEGAVRTSGTLGREDRLIFFADLSEEAYDPRKVYWLVRNGASRPPSPDPEILPANEIRSATLAIRRFIVGEDREFVPGGLPNEHQERFWVDRPFPKQATESVDFPLPDWVFEPFTNPRGRIVVVFPSASDRNYVPASSLQGKSVDLRADGKPIATDLKRGDSGFSFEIEFELPKDIQEPTLSLVYNPAGGIPQRPYLDRFELESVQPMVWSATDSFYELIASASDITGVKIQPDPDRSEASKPPAYAFGRTREGAWVLLDSESEDPFSFLAAEPLTQVSFLPELNAKEIEAVEPFVWPTWFHNPPQAEQLMISPKTFEEALAPLANLNEKYGYRSEWIDLQGIFDLFSGGQFSPFALRNFLSWANRNWPDPQPASILLVGDTSWDAWNRYPDSHQVPNWTPSYHDATAPDFPSDHWFVTGAQNDSLADWLWGRLPCQTIAQLEGYLAKRRDFEERPREDWARRLLWVSDDNAPVEEHIQELFVKILPQAMRLQHLRIRDFPFVDNFYYGPFLRRIQEEARNDRIPLDFGKISPACNSAIRNALTTGASIFVYYGHSGPNVLAHERALFGGGSLYSDIPSLKNLGKAPLAFLMTCDVGRYDYAQPPMKWSVGLSEELLFHPGGGCLGLVASSGKGLPSDHKRLLGGFLDAFFNRGLRASGEILWSGKTQCLIPPGRNLSIDMFTLFGDPLFRPPAPRNFPDVLPSRLKWNRDGSLDLEIELPEYLAGREARGWALGEDLVEEWNWDSVAIPAGGAVSLAFPANVRDRKKLLVALEFSDFQEAGGDPTVTAFGVDLDLVSRPNWVAFFGEEPPNLVLREEEVRLTNYSVREGETLFIEATLRNEGKGAAENVEVRAFDLQTEKEVESFAEYPPADLPLVAPGETRTVRIRWDRWEGTGDFDLKIVVDPENKIHESNKSDNEVIKTVRIYGKPDLAWGLVRGSTEGVIDWNRAQSIPMEWVRNTEEADLQQWSPLRSKIAEADRGILLLVPVTNFGESESATCTLQFVYRFENDAPEITLPPVKIPPVGPSLEGKVVGRPVPVLVLPGVSRVAMEIDPENLLDESDSDNNQFILIPPEGIWDRFPSLAPRRKPPAALQGR